MFYLYFKSPKQFKIIYKPFDLIQSIVFKIFLLLLVLQNTLEVVFGIQDINEKPYDLHVTSDNSQLTFDTDMPKLKENTKGCSSLHILSVYQVLAKLFHH